MSRTFKLTIAYDGTDYAGWQVQPGKPTIQGMLERAMRRISGQSVQVIGSGRTDSGVHALAQVASCSLAWRDTAPRLAAALNANLPDTIVVKHAEDAPLDFHAIRDATQKRYRYQLQLGGTRDVFEYRYRWHLHGSLDIDRIRAAARRFVGTHDFAGFQASGSQRKTTRRAVSVCEVIRQRDWRLTAPSLPAASQAQGGSYWAIDVAADGFLYNMVRNMVGSLVEVGRGRREPEWIDELIASRNRDLAGQTAPAHALFLVHVQYQPFGRE